jgi:hypothetical protein
MAGRPKKPKGTHSKPISVSAPSSIITQLEQRVPAKQRSALIERLLVKELAKEVVVIPESNDLATERSQRINITLPPAIAADFRAKVSERQRSALIVSLLRRHWG